MKTIYRKEYVSILLFLKSARIKKNLSQEELASLLGKDQTYVSKYESGIRRLDVVEVFDICKALDINMKDIISIMENEIWILVYTQMIVEIGEKTIGTNFCKN